MAKLPNPMEHRTADHPIDDLFLRRWSPRAMNGEPVAQEQLLTLFEAARWAPSTYNEQEWRFLYAHREGEHWGTFFNFLAEANQTWCRNAGVLIVVLSHKVFERNGKPNPVHTFDAGAAFENFALQGTVSGLVVHGMAGFDRDKVRAELNVPGDFDVEAMIAVGHPGDPNDLPEQVRDREVPTGRKTVAEFTREGAFDF
jgi:nitroreductase